MSLIKRAQRKKNAEHTYMHTIFRNFLFSIFTSVVVYSRTISNHKNTQKILVVLTNCFNSTPLLCIIDLFNNLHSCATQRKKMRSTHACTHNCAAQRTQYSRRLLSILARPNTNLINSTKWFEDCLTISTTAIYQRVFKNNFFSS